MMPQDIYIGRFLKGKHHIEDYRLEVMFCQLRAFRNDLAMFSFLLDDLFLRLQTHSEREVNAMSSKPSACPRFAMVS